MSDNGYDSSISTNDPTQIAASAGAAVGAISTAAIMEGGTITWSEAAFIGSATAGMAADPNYATDGGLATTMASYGLNTFDAQGALGLLGDAAKLGVDFKGFYDAVMSAAKGLQDALGIPGTSAGGPGAGLAGCGNVDAMGNISGPCDFPGAGSANFN